MESLPAPGLTPSCGESESPRFGSQLQGSLAVPPWAALTFLIWKVGILTVPPGVPGTAWQGVTHHRLFWVQVGQGASQVGRSCLGERPRWFRGRLPEFLFRPSSPVELAGGHI